MLDPITLDQLRMLTTIVDQGGFSAAARKLGRVQSAISAAMGNLEDQLGVALWDRSGHRPTLTADGQAIVASARRVLREVDALRQLAGGIVTGIETRVSLCFDAVFPTDALVELCRGFVAAFPRVELRVDVQAMAAVVARVLEGDASLGVALARIDAPRLERRSLAPIRLLTVVGADHPLARQGGALPLDALEEHVQVVLAERLDAPALEPGVRSPRAWRVLDLHTLRALILGGLGWGNLPEHVAGPDLAEGRLVRIHPEPWAGDDQVLELSVVHRREVGFGPAHRWILDRLPTLCAASGATRRPT